MANSDPVEQAGVELCDSIYASTLVLMSSTVVLLRRLLFRKAFALGPKHCRVVNPAIIAHRTDCGLVTAERHMTTWFISQVSKPLLVPDVQAQSFVL